MNKKSIFKSRTFWVNGAAALVALLESTEVIAIIPDGWEANITSAVFAVNVWLRWVTTQPVSIKPEG